jgi:hypothetical protein
MTVFYRTLLGSLMILIIWMSCAPLALGKDKFEVNTELDTSEEEIEPNKRLYEMLLVTKNTSSIQVVTNYFLPKKLEFAYVRTCNESMRSIIVPPPEK